MFHLLTIVLLFVQASVPAKPAATADTNAGQTPENMVERIGPPTFYAPPVERYRMGAPDMAISNLLGSVLFNVALISVIEPFYRQAPLLSAVSSLNILTALAGIICLCIVTVGIIKRSESK